MNIPRLIFGIAIVIVSTIYLIYIFRRASKDKKYDHITYSFDINIVVGTTIILIAGIVLIFREVL